MQAIKVFVALILTAAGVFSSVLFFNSRTESEYVIKVMKQTEAATVGSTQEAATKPAGPTAEQKPADSKL